jgi:hypothetical protein
MARIRTIKPDFFTSEDIVGLSPLARLLFIATWCEADREGRIVWRPKTLKLRYLPADDCDIDALAAELTDGGLVEVYQVDSQEFAVVTSFTRHQVINNRETPSVIPPQPEDATGTRDPRVTHATGTREDATGTPLSGREGKGRKENASMTRTRKTSLPIDFSISDRVTDWASKKGFERLQDHFDAFVEKARAKDYQYVDWDAALMMAIRQDWAKLRINGGTSLNRRELAL